jgi:hypothetical protein
MARSPITQLIELFHILTPDQQALFLDQVDPQPDEAEKPAKKARKKLTGKSRRASGMAAALNKSLEGQRAVSGTNCTICGNEEGYRDHFKPSPHYHAFAAPKAAQSAAATGN